MFCCTIHDDKNLIELLDMSGSCYKAHKHTLGIVVAAAYSIKKAFVDKIPQLIDTTVESITDGMIIVDKTYKINKMNNVAERILGIRGRSRGMDIRLYRDVVFEDILSMKTSCLEKTGVTLL